MSANIPDTSFEKLKTLFQRDVAQRATKPLRSGVEIAVFIDGNGPATLVKSDGALLVEDRAPSSPDMSFWTTTKGLQELLKNDTNEIGDIGVEILKLMANSDPELKMKAKVHIGTFTLLRNGYMLVLPLGGATVMKFLASKGLSSVGKIKDAISSLKDEK